MKIKKIVLICLMFITFTVSQEAISATDMTSGKTTSSKPALSYEQIKMAAESGDADAQYALGYMFYYGKNGAPKDISSAKAWISKAAAQKQPQAVKAIALMNGKQTETSEQRTAVHNSNPSQSQANDQERYRNAPMEENENRKASSMETAGPSTRHTTEKMTLVDMRQPDNKNRKVEEEVRTSSLASDDTVYTLQLLGASNKEQIKKLVSDHHLAQAKIYKTTFRDKDWYVLIYGQYKTKSEAAAAAKRIESELALKPWIKPWANVNHYKLTAAS